ncbi:MAG: fibrobacter succinogenes major paralogous domain-containing protein, partial [Tannerellaceae bacterium]|nr:fibrobacter succinogenes major paralogous domain-containing protein [Tannerellaceae bacterium]
TFTTADGEEKVYGLPNTVTFNAGYSYSFTFVLNAATKVADGMTNCYIVAPGAELTFLVSRAYTYENKAFTTTLHTGGEYTGAFTAEVVWADALVISGTPTVTGSGNTAEVTVKTNASVSGNAVVKICRSDNGETVWSYHIWVTDYTGAETYTNTYTFSSKQYEFIFMDRNLGATFAGTGTGLGTGLFYQWGRKDPFPATLEPDDTQLGGGSFTAVKTSDVNGTVANAIKNPGVFYFGNSGTGDWLYVSNNTLWGYASDGGTKTIYDPCPSGWRVPVNPDRDEYRSPWKGFTSSNGGTWNNGYSWGTNAAYPAAGFRSNYSGSILDAGTAGCYWSASPNGNIYALDLYFISGGVYKSSYAARIGGRLVRCVQE